MNIQGIGLPFSSMYASQFQPGTQAVSSDFTQPLMDAAEIMAKDDADENGVLSIEETPLNEDMFSDADSDSDGELTTDELDAFLASGPPAMGPPPMMGPPPEAAATESEDKEDTVSSESFASDLLSLLDTDGDGQISQAELAQAIEESSPPEPLALETDENVSAYTAAFAINAYQDSASALTAIAGGSQGTRTVQQILSGIIA